MTDRSQARTVVRVTDLCVDDRITVRSLETDKEETFLVSGFEFSVIDGRPQVKARLRTPDDQPGAIVLLDTPDGICLRPTGAENGRTIEAHVTLFESPGKEETTHRNDSPNEFDFG